MLRPCACYKEVEVHTQHQSSYDAGDKDLPKLDTRQWAAALRRLRGNATLQRLDFERVIERMHAQVW